MQKTCAACGLSLPVSDFSRRKASKDGLQPICRACDAQRRKARKKANPEAERIYQREYRLRNMARRKAAARARYVAKHDELREQARAYYIANKSAHAECGRKWREKNKEKERLRHKRRRLAFGEIIREQRRSHYRHNKSRYVAQARAREELVKQATPPWADMEAIYLIYADRARIERETGVRQNVDHIVPIHGKNVCGLHVHYNLRVIPAEDNLTKSNHFDDAIAQMVGI